MARYSDLNLDFTPHPITGDVAILTDRESIKRSVRNLVLTARYDRPFKPELDAGVRKYLFEPMTPVTVVKLKNAIENVVKSSEPRAELVDVVVVANEQTNSFDVRILFRPKNINETVQVNLTLERTR